MENGNSKKADKFFEGKGFYIVLALCVAVIGISAISILTNSGKEPAGADVGMTLMESPAPVTETAPVINREDPAPVTENKDPAVETWSSGETFNEAPRAWVWPVMGELEREYCIETLKYDVTMKDWRVHDGIDVLAKQGELVRAASSGTVESVADDDLYGTTVVIDHGDGIKSVYSNLADKPAVKTGDTVKAGDVIGSVGDTALCETGEQSHLHLSMSENGNSIDPAKYLPNG